MTNKEFSQTDAVFIKACSDAGLPSHINTIKTRKKSGQTPGSTSLQRQASKWRMGRGKAFKTFKGQEVA